MNPVKSRLLGRQRNLTSELLRYYAGRLVLTEQLVHSCTEDSTRNTLNDIRNAFLDRICIIACILFVGGSQDKDTYYLCLVDTDDDSVTLRVCSFAKTILGNISNARPQELLNKVLLELSGVTAKEFKDAKKELEPYRNNFAAHAADYAARTHTEIITYPRLFNWAKLAYGLLKIINTIHQRDLGSFEDIIGRIETDFKKGIAFIYNTAL